MTTYVGNPPKSVYGVKDATNLLYREITTAAAASHTISGVFQDYNMEDTLILDITGIYIGTGNSGYVYLNGDTNGSNYRSMENYRDSALPSNSLNNSASSYIGWFGRTGYYSHRITITPIKVVGGTRFKLDCELRLNGTNSPYEGTLVSTSVSYVATQSELTSIQYLINGTTNIQANTMFSVYNATATNLILPLEYSAPRKNYLMNTAFQINQRGYVDGTLTGLYGVMYDRWISGVANSSMTVSGRICTIVGSLYQKIESGTFVVGDIVTMSWKGSSTCAFGSNIDTISTEANKVVGRVSAIGHMPIGLGAGTVSDLKVELGDTATPYEVPVIQEEFSRCQRYYEVATSTYRGIGGTSTGVVGSPIAFKQTKPTVPTIALIALGIPTSAISLNGIYGVTIEGAGVQWNVTSPIAYTYGATFSVSAEI